MTSNHAIEPQDAAPAHSPAVNAAQVNVTSTGDVQVIVRENGPGEPWFQMLRREFEDGTWAQLHDRHRNVLPVMCSLRDRDNGLAYAPAADFRDAAGTIRPGLLTRTGMSKTALYLAIGEMSIDPRDVPLDAPGYKLAAAGLLARAGRDLFVVLPDRVFAGRKPAPPSASRVPCTGLPVPPTGIEHRAVPSTGLQSRPREFPPLLHRETRARSEELRIKNSSTTTSLSAEDLAEAIRILGQGFGEKHPGFGHRDAMGIMGATQASLLDVRTAAANANHKAGSTSDPLKSWRGYVRRQLEQGCTLFPAIQREVDSAERVASRLRSCAEHLGDEDSVEMLRRWADRAGNRGVARLMQDPSWREDDEAFWSHVTRRVSIEISG